MLQTDLSRFNNQYYKPGGRFKIMLWYVVNSWFLNTYLPIPVPIKTLILKIFGAKIGNKVMIKPKVNIKYPWFLEIGDHAWIGEQVWIDNLAPVRIGAHACVSQGAMLLTGNHNYASSTFDLITQPIVLEAGVWIGAKAVVCPGVVCKSHAVLTVGSVATKSLEAYAIYQGNPAKFVKTRVIAS